jgi:hypothetical protein
MVIKRITVVKWKGCARGRIVGSDDSSEEEGLSAVVAFFEGG